MYEQVLACRVQRFSWALPSAHQWYRLHRHVRNQGHTQGHAKQCWADPLVEDSLFYLATHHRLDPGEVRQHGIPAKHHGKAHQEEAVYAQESTGCAACVQEASPPLL